MTKADRIRHPIAPPGVHRLIQALNVAFLAAIVWVANPSRAGAMSTIPQTWQQLVYDADLVGIVECETAGSIVAKYRVVESWKGPTVGTKLTLLVTWTVFGPSYPLALVGDRFLITARRIEPNFIAPTSLAAPPGGGHPLAWRRIPAEYRTPLHQGLLKLPLDEVRGRLWAIGSPHSDLDSFHASVDSMLALTPAKQEEAVLRSVSDYYLSRMMGNGDSTMIDHLSDKLSGADTAGIARVWLEMLRGSSPGAVSGPMGVLPTGGPITLALFEADSARARYSNDDLLAHLMKRIRIRLRLAPEDAFEDAAKADTTYADVHQLGIPRTDPAFFLNFRRTFQGLCVSRPQVIADYLVAWPGDESTLYGSDWAFAMGSYFGWKCGSERARHFTRLLQARDPYIQVAAATYLRFEDEQAGLKALANLARLSGDPGSWAALTLARYGHKEQVPRLIETLRVMPFPTSESTLLREIQQQFLVLLSNSAHEGGIAPVGIWSEGSPLTAESAGQLYYESKDWWARNASRIKLYDPWLATLKRQKID